MLVFHGMFSFCLDSLSVLSKFKDVMLREQFLSITIVVEKATTVKRNIYCIILIGYYGSGNV